MDKKVDVIEKIIGNMPKWVMGVLAFVTAVISFVNLIRGNYYLGFTIFGMLIFASLFTLFIYLIFAKVESPIVPGEIRYRYKNARNTMKILLLVTLLAFITLFFVEPSHSFVSTAFIGTPTLTPSPTATTLPTSTPAATFTPSPTPTIILSPTTTHIPLAFPIEQDEEILIIIVDFDDRSAGEYAGIDPAQRIYDMLSVKKSDFKKIRLEQYHHVIKDDRGAKDLLKLYKGTILIWGWYDKLSVESRTVVFDDRVASKLPFCSEFDLAAAKDISVRFVQHVPVSTSYMTFLALGITQYYEDNPYVAIEYFNEAIKISSTGSSQTNPSGAWAWRGYTNVYQLNNIKQGVDEISRAIELDSSYSSYFSMRAAVYKDWLDEEELAIKDYTTAIEIDPNEICYHGRRGSLYFELGNYEKAIEDYNKEIEIDPDSLYLSSRGMAYFELGKYEIAFEDFDRAIELNAEDEYPYYKRGWAYYKQKNYDQAIQDFNKAIELDPEYYCAYDSRGWAYYKQKNYDQAIQNFNKAIELDPKGDDAYDGRGWTYYEQSEYDQAIQDFNKAIALDLKRVDAYRGRGWSYYEQSKYDQAIQDFNKAIALDPESDGAYNGRGWSYYEQGKYDQAIQDFNKAIALDPEYENAYYGRGWSYYEQSKYDQAIQDFNKIIALDPEYASAYYGRAQAYRSIGDKVKAIADFQRYLELETDPYWIEKTNEYLQELGVDE